MYDRRFRGCERRWHSSTCVSTTRWMRSSLAGDLGPRSRYFPPSGYCTREQNLGVSPYHIPSVVALSAVIVILALWSSSCVVFYVWRTVGPPLPRWGARLVVLVQRRFSSPAVVKSSTTGVADPSAALFRAILVAPAAAVQCGTECAFMGCVRASCGGGPLVRKVRSRQ